MDENATGAEPEVSTDSLEKRKYYLSTVYKWEGDKTQPLEDLFLWRSKKFLLPRRTAFSCARIIAETGDRQAYQDLLAAQAALVAANAVMVSGHTLGGSIGDEALGDETVPLGGDLLVDAGSEPEYSGDFMLTLNFYADGVLKFTKDVYSSGVPFRLSQGYRGRTFEVEITGNVPVRRIDVANSMKELKMLDGGE